MVINLLSKLLILKKISRVATFKTRTKIADGIFISKLMNLMPLCEDYLVKILQVLQNKAAKVMT